MGHGLCCVEHGQRARVGGQLEQVLVGRPLAGGIGTGGERQHAGAGVEQGAQIRGVQPPLGIGLQHA